MSTTPAKTALLPIFVEVVLPIPIRRSFTYRIPEVMRETIATGTRLELPFGKKNLIGYAVALHTELPQSISIDETKIKDVIKVLDEGPRVTPEILKLTEWAAEYYASSWGEMLKGSMPAGIDSGKVHEKLQDAVRLLPPKDGSENNAKPPTIQQSKIIELLAENGGDMLVTDVIGQTGLSASPINTLAKRGIVEVYRRQIVRDPLAGIALPEMKNFDPTDEQAAALTAIEKALAASEYKAFLLHGVTSSGKTEIYFRAMRKALDRGKSALMLVPEVALTPVFSKQLRTVFGMRAAILHSKLSHGKRFDEWNRVLQGEAHIVIGTRLSVFAPLKNIGLLIVDEEHDPSYRSHESPYYHARDVAVMRASLAGAVVVLGSATPAIESFHNAKTEKYSYLRLQNRIGGRPLAKAKLINMSEVFKKAGKDVVLSPQLVDAIRETHAKGEQIIVLLNRRGFSQFVFCRMCGESLKCRSCDITLTFHRSENRLVCHYCNKARKDVPNICPNCESEYLHFAGGGTEKIEDMLAKKFPSMRIARVDRDTIKRKGEMDKILDRFATGEIDMLVGTQMIAKGHDFPNVTLVGVIGIDIGLGLPDLRSAERTFQLITQVAGRAGRGDRPGRVLIQTYHPEHYALRFAEKQDYDGFYREEIKFRERFGYPPFLVLASISIKHYKLVSATRNAGILRRALDKANAARDVRILGPAPASLSRLKNEYRIQIILKGASRRSLRQTLDNALAIAESSGCDMRTIHVEIDPVNLM